MINVYMDDIRNIPEYWVNDEDCPWVPIRKAEDVIYLLQLGIVNDLSLDHDMGNDSLGCKNLTGYELICWMKKASLWPKGTITIHSASHVGAQKMRQALKDKQ